MSRKKAKINYSKQEIDPMLEQIPDQIIDDKNESAHEDISGLNNELVMELLTNIRLFIEEQVQKNPYRSLAIGFGLGIAIGKSFGRKSSILFSPFIGKWIAKAIFRKTMKIITKKLYHQRNLVDTE